MFNDFYRGKRVLLTGHTGFKGSWLSLWLLELGAQVAGFSKGIPSQPSLFQVLGLEERMFHRTGDIRNSQDVDDTFEIFQPQLVFHLAAQPIVGLSYESPKTTFDTNTGGTINILEAIRTSRSVTAGVLITSDKCYENVEQEHGYIETDRLGGHDPYSASKAAAELAISAYAHSFADNGKGIASARAGNVIGGGDWAVDRLVVECVRAWASNSTPQIRNPHATRPWQHVLEPLSGYLQLMALLASACQNRHKATPLHAKAFNFGPPDDDNYSVMELVTEMTRAWPGQSWTDASGRTKSRKEATLLKLNCHRARQMLGWHTSLSFTEAVGMTIDWYRRYYRNDGDFLANTVQQIEAYQTIARKRGSEWAQIQQPLGLYEQAQSTASL